MVNIITRTTLFSNPDKNIFEIINTRSNIVDPKSRGVNGKFVYRNDPWSKGSDYQSYPYIILRFPNMTKNNSNVSGNVKDITWSQKITVRTIMGTGAFNNTTGDSKGVTDMQDILDDLHETFDSKTIKDTLRATKLYNIKLEVDASDDFADDNGKHIFETELTLTYDTRLQIGV